MHTCCGSTHEWHLAGCSGPRSDEWIRHVGPMFDSVHFLGADKYHCEIFTPKHCPVYLSIRPVALTQDQAKKMAKYLLTWSETGTLDVSEKSKNAWKVIVAPDGSEHIQFKDANFDDALLSSVATKKDVFFIEVGVDILSLYRHQVERLINHLQSWLDTGSLHVK